MTAINCPVCQADFKEVIRDGILIDICTQCRGVWLDRGELEKLLEAVRNDNQDFEMKRQTQMRDKYKNDYKSDQHLRYDQDDYHHERKDKYRKKSKMESFFDVFG